MNLVRRTVPAYEAFALVEIRERVRVVVTGEAAVDALIGDDAGRGERVQARPGEHERGAVLDGASALALGSAARRGGAEARPGPADLPLRDGVVQAAWLGWAQDERSSVAPVPTPAEAAPVRADPVPAAPVRPTPIAPEPATGPDGTIDLDEAVRGLRRPRIRDPRLLPETPSPAAGAPDAPDDSRFDDTVARSPQTGRRRAEPETPAPVSAALRFGVRIAGGDVQGLESPLIIGRAPKTPRDRQESDVTLIRVASPNVEVSSTHLEVRQDGPAVVVTDLHSTNGTYVQQPGSRHVRLRPGESLVVAPGTAIDIGDGVVLEVVQVQR